MSIKKYLTKYFMVSIIIVTSMILNTVVALAYEPYTVNIIGDMGDKFRLTSDSESIFNTQGIAPGNTMSANIIVSNNYSKDMRLDLENIIDNSSSRRLIECMYLKISDGEKVIYEGSYGSVPSPVFTGMVIPSKNVKNFQVLVSLPANAGNELQNSELKATWNFDAEVDETSKKPSSGSSGGSSSGKPSVAESVTYSILCYNSNGEVISSIATSGLYGDEIVIKAPVIQGYTPTESEKIVKIGFENDVKFTYIKNDEIIATEKPNTGSNVGNTGNSGNNGNNTGNNSNTGDTGVELGGNVEENPSTGNTSTNPVINYESLISGPTSLADNNIGIVKNQGSSGGSTLRYPWKHYKNTEVKSDVTVNNENEIENNSSDYSKQQNKVTSNNENVIEDDWQSDSKNNSGATNDIDEAESNTKIISTYITMLISLVGVLIIFVIIVIRRKRNNK